MIHTRTLLGTALMLVACPSEGEDEGMLDDDDAGSTEHYWGVVSNSRTGEPMEGIAVDMGDWRTITNDAGEYALDVPIGHEPQLDIERADDTLDSLISCDNERDKVVYVASEPSPTGEIVLTVTGAEGWESVYGALTWRTETTRSTRTLFGV
jgi:hypothetical protein